MRSIVMLLPLLMGAGQADDAEIRETPADVQRAYELFQGVWSFASVNDNGEKFGPELIHRAFAQNGHVTVKGRSFVIVNPDTGHRRTARFRLDPSKTPHRIDLINRDDRSYRGIYKFDGDSLLICLERDQEGPRPSDFEVSEGSDHVLFRLTPTGLKEATRTVGLGIALDDTVPSDVKSPEITAPEPAKDADRPASSPTSERRATEAEIRRAHQMLAGEWEILSIVDDGSDVGPKLIRAKFAEDGRLRIGNRIASFVTPSTEEKHVSAIRIDPAKNPSWIDLTSQLDAVLKGIYRFDGDQLILCLAKHEDGHRPTEFEAPAGSDRALFRLAIAKPLPKAKPAAEPAPAPKPVTVTKTEPTPEEKERRREQRIRDLLAGSWSYSDSKGAVTLVLRPDGTFVSTRAWSKAIKRMFEGQTSTSDGRWSYSEGMLTGRIYSTTSPSLVGHGFSARLQSIGEDTLVFKDVVGELRTARKLR